LATASAIGTYGTSRFSSSSSSSSNDSDSDSGAADAASNEAEAHALVRIIQADQAHCKDMVEQRDHHAFLVGLLLPQSQQPAYYALKALNVEIASIKDSLNPNRGNLDGAGGGEDNNSNTNDYGDPNNYASPISNPGSIRLQWWRDAIDDVYNEETLTHARTNHAALHQPVMRSLARSIRQHRLTRVFFDRLLDAREHDLDVSQHPTVQHLVEYSEETASSLLYLILESAASATTSTSGADNNDDDDNAMDIAYEVASHIGVATGIVTALRSTAPLASRRGELSIPNDLMRKHSVKSPYLLNPKTDRPAIFDPLTASEDLTLNYNALRGATMELANIAMAHMSEARAKQSKIPTEQQTSLLLSAVPVMHYLDTLTSNSNNKKGACDYDVLHPDVNVNFAPKGSVKLPLLLGRTWLTGVF
jgi:NADH dehydrogenase [ubiquinone] 1 alpha subcomplex assembly factor 6